MSRLCIPDNIPGDTIDAALAYAAAGIYVIPVRRGTKDPGSVLRKGWPSKSTIDPQVIYAYWAGTDHGIALHCGRSGLVVVDLDHPDQLDDQMRAILDDPKVPFQSTRTDDPQHGHYVFAMPEGRRIGNPGRPWGEVRGANGVIMTAPSHHPDGGCYSWKRTGPVPILPAVLADQWTDSHDSNDAVTDAAVSDWIERHGLPGPGSNPGALAFVLTKYRKMVAAGNRHDALKECLAVAIRDVNRGWYDPGRLMKLYDLHGDALGDPTHKNYKPTDPKRLHRDWSGLMAWLLAQIGDDPGVDGIKAHAAPVPGSTEELFAQDRARRAGSRLPRPAAGSRGTPVSAAIAKVPTTSTTPAVAQVVTMPAANTDTGRPSVTEDRDQAQATITPLRGKDDQAPNPWEPLDLGPYLDDEREPERATMLVRSDGVCLIYAGRVHSLHGESESGKSFLAQYLVAVELIAGHHVLYLDYESDPGSVIARLLALGVGKGAIGRFLVYVNPEAPPEQDPTALALLINLRRYTLAVVDGVTEALAVSRASSNDNDEVTRWARALPQRIVAVTGAGVIMVDHVQKSPDGRGRWALGAQAKMAGLTGAAYTLEVDAPMGRGLVGVLRLRVGKDRPGGVRPHCGPFRKADRTQLAAVVTFDSSKVPIAVTVAAPDTEDEQTGPASPWRPTTYMERVSDAIASADGPLSFNQINARVTGKEAHIRKAIDLLIAEGFVITEPGPRGAVMHTNHHRYWQARDPLSDRFIERETAE